MNWIDGKHCSKLIQKGAGTDISIRFREIPPFGIDGIRKIRSNRSELKKMTAHDYEDMLQVCVTTSIPDLTNIIHVVCYTRL
jgi:hypothetical protein